MLAPTTTAWRWVVVSIAVTGPGQDRARRTRDPAERDRAEGGHRVGEPGDLDRAVLRAGAQDALDVLQPHRGDRGAVDQEPGQVLEAEVLGRRHGDHGAAHVGHAVDGDVRDLAAVVPGEQRCAGRGLHQRGEDHGVAVLVAGEGVVAVPRRPDGDVVAEVTDEDVVARRGSPVRPADEDVAARPPRSVSLPGCR
jgi:hypothetical protein